MRRRRFREILDKAQMSGRNSTAPTSTCRRGGSSGPVRQPIPLINSDYPRRSAPEATRCTEDNTSTCRSALPCPHIYRYGPRRPRDDPLTSPMQKEYVKPPPCSHPGPPSGTDTPPHTEASYRGHQPRPPPRHRCHRCHTDGTCGRFARLLYSSHRFERHQSEHDLICGDLGNRRRRCATGATKGGR